LGICGTGSFLLLSGLLMMSASDMPPLERWLGALVGGGGW